MGPVTVVVVSDVWQGPGWWLASDGKWYPADAEPGAVYEGDLQNSDDSETDAPPEAPAMEPVEEPLEPADSTPPVEAVLAAPALAAPVLAPSVDVPEPDVAIPDLAAPVAEIPDVPAPDVTIPDLAAPVAEIPDAPAPDVTIPDLELSEAEASVEDLGAPVAAMPDPIVESASGWQTITEAPAPEPELDIETEAASFEVLENHSTTVEEDGWTSAFEERQAGSEVLDDIAPPDAVAAPPSIDLPEPDTDIQDLAATTSVATEPDIPEIVVPDDSIPEAPNRGAVAAPIERQDAWRKPVSGEDIRQDLAAGSGATATATRAPEVVDLAIPEDHKHEIIEPPKRGVSMWLGLLAVIALVVLIAFLLARLFAGNSTTNTEDAPTTTTTAVEDVEDVDTTAAPESSDAAAAADEPAADDETTTSDVQQASVFDLRAGDCIVGDIGAGQVTSVEKVDCEIAHQFEVYREALIESSITSFDEVAISAYAEEVCRTSLDAYVPDNTEQNLRFKFLQPTEDSWNQAEDPDRVITCLLFDGDEEELIGRAR